jgi:putative oxidoreductase
MALLIDRIFEWRERVSRNIEWLASLLARFIIGWESRSRGMGQLQNLSAIVPDFVNWPIPSAQILAPFVSGVEFFGVMFLLIGFLTRISAGAGSVSVDRLINPNVFARQRNRVAPVEATP